MGRAHTVLPITPEQISNSRSIGTSILFALPQRGMIDAKERPQKTGDSERFMILNLTAVVPPKPPVEFGENFRPSQFWLRRLGTRRKTARYRSGVLDAAMRNPDRLRGNHRAGVGAQDVRETKLISLALSLNE